MEPLDKIKAIDTEDLIGSRIIIEDEFCLRAVQPANLGRCTFHMITLLNKRYDFRLNINVPRIIEVSLNLNKPRRLFSGRNRIPFTVFYLPNTEIDIFVLEYRIISQVINFALRGISINFQK